MKSAVLCLIVVVFLWPSPIFADGIYGNGSSGKDSIAVSIFITDSLGNPSMTSADSFCISVIGPSGDSIISIAGPPNAVGLNIDSLQTAMEGWKYIYAEAVSEIDGAGRAGVYELTFCAKDIDPGYVNCTVSSFQLTTLDFNDQLTAITDILDSMRAVLDTLRNQDDWVSSFDASGDTVLIDYRPIAGEVWDELQSEHNAPGSFGNYLDAPISGFSSPAGSGVFPVTITALDSINDQTIPAAKLAVHNLTLDAMIAFGLTSSDGTASFNLDSGVYLLSGFAPGYIFSVFDTIVVSGAKTDTIGAVRFDPGQPASPDLCRVYGYIYGIDGLPVSGVTVAAEISDGVVRYNSMIISPYRVTSLSDSAGYFCLDLIPSGRLDPVGTGYSFSAHYPSGTILKKILIVPDSSAWILAW